MNQITFTNNQSQTNGVFQLRQPPTYFWCPKDDITTIELAKSIPISVAGTIRDYQSVEQLYNSLPENCKRHWKVKHHNET